MADIRRAFSPFSPYARSLGETVASDIDEKSCERSISYSKWVPREGKGRNVEEERWRDNEEDEEKIGIIRAQILLRETRENVSE